MATLRITLACRRFTMFFCIFCGLYGRCYITKVFYERWRVKPLICDGMWSMFVMLQVADIPNAHEMLMVVVVVWWSNIVVVKHLCHINSSMISNLHALESICSQASAVLPVSPSKKGNEFHAIIIWLSFVNTNVAWLFAWDAFIYCIEFIVLDLI